MLLSSSHPQSFSVEVAYEPPADDVTTSLSRFRRHLIWISVATLLGAAIALTFKLASHRAGLGGVSSFAAKPDPPPPYLLGWTHKRWVLCQKSQACPVKALDIPQHGCQSGDANRRVLLTADGLSSQNVRDEFQHLLKEVMHVRTSRHKADEARVLLVLDAAYEAFKAGTSKSSSYQYCAMRGEELTSLGASAVICVIVDPSAREELWKGGWKREANATPSLLPRRERGIHSKDFADRMRNINDDYLFDELNRAAAIFVDCGTPRILLENFRRSLDLRGSVTPSHDQKSFANILRSRVLHGSGDLLYVGVSSGSSVAGKSVIEMSDKETSRLGGDRSGLGLLPNCSFFPHVDNVNGTKYAPGLSTLQELAARYHTEVMAVPDCQPVVDTGATNGHLSHVCP